MLLKKMIISKTYPEYEIIRNIKFNKQGLNLIIDNTTDNSEDSGNNVGKTTFIKIIDLCLGAKSVKTIYHDNDTKSDNEIIKDFLKEYKVEAELEIEDEISQEIYLIKRQLYANGSRFIDNVLYTKDDFDKRLKEIMFNSNEKYPTLRELMPKFIRIDNNTNDNIIKFLGNFSKNHQYDAVYQYLFKILDEKLINEKNELSNNRNTYINRIKLLENDNRIDSLDILKQKQKIIINELDTLSKERQKLNYVETYKDELDNKRNLTIQINNCEQELQLLELDIELLNKSIDELRKDKTNIDMEQLKQVYEEAKIFSKDIQLKFEDVVNFHNSMIENRISFFVKQKKEKEKRIQEIKKTRDDFIEEKKKITVELLDEGLLTDLNVLNSKIEKLSIEKGEIDNSIRLLEENIKERENIDKKIDELHVALKADKINDNIELFNKFFTEYTENIYGEKYLFAYNSNWDSQKQFPVQISNFNGIVGTGMKKGMIVAFDFAYLKYSNELSMNCPKFIIHDKLETTHINQLRTIFEMSSNINGQYIVPILRERIKDVDSNIIEKAKILELSKNKKLFKI
ncbi:MAG: DUF2326 domain-containing protein [Clostridia bacterium]|nr:DUF2326 domain-containing protein [Clostridia bacterium]